MFGGDKKLFSHSPRKTNLKQIFESSSRRFLQLFRLNKVTRAAVWCRKSPSDDQSHLLSGILKFAFCAANLLVAYVCLSLACLDLINVFSTARLSARSLPANRATFMKRFLQCERQTLDSVISAAIS